MMFSSSTTKGAIAVIGMLGLIALNRPAHAQYAIDKVSSPSSDFKIISANAVANDGSFVLETMALTPQAPCGFVVKGDSVEPFTVAGASYFGTRDLNPSGASVGYAITANNNIVGFLRDRSGRVTQITVPGGAYTFANGINESGTIVGTYWDANFGSHGFILDRGKITPFNVPGATATELSGINASGTAIGTYSNVTGIHPFVLDTKGVVTKLTVPGAVWAFGFALNHYGHSVGCYMDSNHTVHGYALKDGVLTPIDYTDWPSTISEDVPGYGTLTLTLREFGTDVRGINNRGDIVGRGFANYYNAQYAFLKTEYTGFSGSLK